MADQANAEAEMLSDCSEGDDNISGSAPNTCVWEDPILKLIPKELEHIVPQSAMADKRQVLNYGGGYVFTITDLNRLRRFLILGCEGGTYYVKEKELQESNAKHVIGMIEKGDGMTVLNETLEISESGRSPKQGPAIYCLALCARYAAKELPPAERDELRRKAYEYLPRICRIPTHLFEFVSYCEKMNPGSTGWGRSQRKAIKHWYLDKEPRNLAYLVTKYVNRLGWSHLDVLRLAHPKPKKEQAEHNDIFLFVKSGFEAVKERRIKASSTEGAERDLTNDPFSSSEALQLLQAVHALKGCQDDATAAELIKRHRLVREHVPTPLLKSRLVWEALLEEMPFTAMLRCLNRLSVVGILTEGSKAAADIVSRLRDMEHLRKARVHPMALLMAHATYKNGMAAKQDKLIKEVIGFQSEQKSKNLLSTHANNICNYATILGKGYRGSLEWTPVPSVVDALEKAFYNSFSLVEPTGKRFCIGIDISGSMAEPISGSALSAAHASTAMSLIHFRTESHCSLLCFSMNIDEVDVKKFRGYDDLWDHITNNFEMSATDCALPMLWAAKHDKKFDVFVIYTDNETWYGFVHPFVALQHYRQKSGIEDAKLIVVAMTATEFTIADPNDPYMLDVVGFDPVVPEMMNKFILGQI
ncbi:60 kDa SS A:Ro ribonucleoprotein [Trichuris trichiura]|uniref:60 kDa SS A:Ro ribonucleoprotein n=1 Tax=Trichuris trichiura TaxID=36087 RepID=A0A077Z1S1_TRITR|nr:60 kDa SS A:Ro ribonucleoprotein [Trichuris trichiura]